MAKQTDLPLGDQTRPELTEKEFTNALGELLDHHGLLWDHIRPARTKHGWVTPIQGSQGHFPKPYGP